MGFLSDNFISDAILLVLKWLYEFISDYTLVVILLTVAIRVLILPLDIRQRKNSRMMANIGPEVESLKKRYANNPDQLQRKINELYRERNIKPMAGCLPMLIQLPLLFAFFGAMRAIASEQSVSIILRAVENGAESIELPGMLWVHNIWQPDSGSAGVLPSAAEFLTFLQQNAGNITPQTMALLAEKGIISYNGALTVVESTYGALSEQIIAANGLTGFNNGWFGLPVLAGASMLLQQKLSTKNNPQMQQQGKVMMYMMPIISVWFCATSNAVFAIYWFVSNLVAIVTNLVYDLIIKAKDKKTAAPSGAMDA
ncbi:MAG: membrane protein insertase YidC [Christensenellaceae bacterium]|nr:membrane protein insertase YidC [Christensenellaceae bacterium]